jgi:hypothetical protein
MSSGAISGLSFSAPTHANAVFAVLDPEISDRIPDEISFLRLGSPDGRSPLDVFL